MAQQDSNRNKRIAFLIGAGIAPPGYPRTNDITEAVINGKYIDEFMQQSYDNGDIVENNIRVEETGKSITIRENEANIFKYDMMILIRMMIGEVYRTINYDNINRNQSEEVLKPNYEYVFEMLYGIKRFLDDNTLNIEIRYFIDSIMERVKNLSSFNRIDDSFEGSLYKYAVYANSYIEYTIVRELSQRPDDLSVFGLFKNVCNDNSIVHIDIFTLNHDCNLETYFKRENIHYSDGFGKRDGDIDTWDVENYRDQDKIHIYKLHGSMNWYIFESKDNNNRKEIYGMPWGNDCKQNIFEDEEGNTFTTDCVPLIMTGLTSKTITYNAMGYSQVQYLFYKAMTETNTIIVSGYGFGDSGINTRLNSWLGDTRQENRILVIRPEDGSPYPAALAEMYRIHGSLGNPDNNGRCIICDKRFEDTTWQEIKQTLKL